jgi:hypothetical protein
VEELVQLGLGWVRVQVNLGPGNVGDEVNLAGLEEALAASDEIVAKEEGCEEWKVLMYETCHSVRAGIGDIRDLEQHTT